MDPIVALIVTIVVIYLALHLVDCLELQPPNRRPVRFVVALVLLIWVLVRFGILAIR